MAGSLAFTESTLTISSGSVTATRSAHIIAAESGTADDLANIATGSVSDNAILLIRPDSGDTITVKHAATGAGEIHLAGDADYIMSSDESLMVQRRGADWYEISRDGVVDASNAEMEAASSSAIASTPGRQQRHPGHPKGWCQYDHINATIDASYNVTSIADDATGIFTITWAIDFSGASYCFVGLAKATAATTPMIVSASDTTAQAAGTSTLIVNSDSGVATDADLVSVVALGDQA